MPWTGSRQEIPTGHSRDTRSQHISNTSSCYPFWHLPWMRQGLSQRRMQEIPCLQQACCNCGKSGNFARVCSRKHSAAGQYRKPTTPNAQALSTNELPIVKLSELAHGPATPAPTVNMQVSTCHRQGSLNVLPDSGAKISAAVQALGKYMDNLAPSNICPKDVNGSILHPVGKLPHVDFCSVTEQFMMMSTSMTRSPVH